MFDRHQVIEEPYESKDTCTVLKERCGEEIPPSTLTDLNIAKVG
jgi:hypothetical protein